MDYYSFFDEVKKQEVELSFDNKLPTPTPKLNNEALFHLPLIAITILILAKDKRKPKTEELGQIVGECFERTFVGFKGSSQHLGWSANLRMRTVKALTFLELSQLVDVRQGKLSASQLGKKIAARALSENTDLAYTLTSIARHYRNIKVEKQLALELS